jgi:hypothetical protein
MVTVAARTWGSWAVVYADPDGNTWSLQELPVRG